MRGSWQTGAGVGVGGEEGVGKRLLERALEKNLSRDTQKV